MFRNGFFRMLGKVILNMLSQQKSDLLDGKFHHVG